MVEIIKNIALDPLYYWWVRLIIVFFAGFLYNDCNELEDECVRSTWKKPFRFLWFKRPIEWLNIKTSSNNKWKLKDGKKILYTGKDWYYLCFRPKYVESFRFSSTIKVYKTDGEHYFQFHKNNFILLGFAATFFPASVIWFVGKSLFQLVKEKFLKSVN